MSEEIEHRPLWEIPGARMSMQVLAPRTIQGAGLPWSHEVTIALPATYDVMPTRRYPVLWVTDGPSYIQLATALHNLSVMSGLAPELIMVAVGCPQELGMAEHTRRRNSEFYPPGPERFFDGPGGEFMRRMAQGLPDMDISPRADALLDLLIDQLRPALASEFRFADDHALFGHSGGGMFANYALFARPGAFKRFIIGSPSSNAAGRAAFRLEAEYAANNTDLAADIFFGAAESEVGNLGLAAWGIVSAPVLMAETLLLRQYPSLKLKTRIFSGRNHGDVVIDLFTHGIQTIYAREAAKLPKPFD